MSRTYRILLVCMGNICRSPMAEVLLRRRLADAGGSAIVAVSSAGFLNSGRPASQPAEVVMRERALDLTRHLSRTVTEEMLAEQDLVLAMEEEQAAELRALAPAVAARIDSLVGFATRGAERGDIFDPYGEAMSVYRRVADRLDTLLEGVVQRLGDEGVL